LTTEEKVKTSLTSVGIPFVYVLKFTIPSRHYPRRRLVLSIDKPFIASAMAGICSNPLLTVLMRDMSTNEPFMSNPIQWEHFIGTSQKPFYFIEPLVLASGTKLEFQFENESGVKNHVMVQIIGEAKVSIKIRK
jgi:hypothetical protein